MQPERNGRVRCGTRLGIISGSFLSFPSSPGIEKPHRRKDGANPCQRRRFCEQPNGKNGIDDPPDKVDDVPRNFALFLRNRVGWRCHSRIPMRPAMPNYDSTSQSFRQTQQKWSVQTRSRCALRRGTTADGSLVAAEVNVLNAQAKAFPYANAPCCKTTFP